MAHIRHIQLSDRSELASLWSLRFGDSAAFTDWFFTERCSPAHSLCMEENGRIVSVIHAWPMRLNIRQRHIPALMLCGVATLPGHERKGYMHALMRAMLQSARQNGFPLVFHKPNRFETYASLSQLPCTDTLYHRVQNTSRGIDSASEWNEEELMRIYRLAVARYSGCVVRDEAAMRLKHADYRADGARLVTTEGGYAVLFPREHGWYGEETLAIDEAAYRSLLSRLPDGALVKLPPDLPFLGELRPQNAMGAADIAALLSMLCGDASLLFEVNDPAVQENCGIFDGCGRRRNAAQALKLSSGELVQYLCGYKAYRSLVKQCCFCVDEY